jgi:hypothetical protein
MGRGGGGGQANLGAAGWKRRGVEGGGQEGAGGRAFEEAPNYCNSNLTSAFFS